MSAVIVCLPLYSGFLVFTTVTYDVSFNMETMSWQLLCKMPLCGKVLYRLLLILTYKSQKLVI